MNIFVLDNDIEKCAQYYCDKHVIKMILESAQMLSATLRLNGIDKGYQVTHKNHPCTKWTRESLSNWKWLKKLATSLNKEYKFRFSHQINHKSYDLIKILPIPKIKDYGLTPFAQAMPNEFKNKNPIKAYRDFYCSEKKNILFWTKRTKPEWIKIN
jgi:hypothetical protein